ncbi:MAG: C69 family dipeptidase [Promethearchaeota archaeon]
MCDTYVALNSVTKDGNIIFGKNSDRILSETQLITYAPRKQYESNEKLKCTYIEIPQVSETYAVLLSQPYWIWGAEMGANEHNVVIGNEAVWSKEPLEDNGLLGMDLLRLGLERSKTAREALNIITELLEEFGQGGVHLPNGLNYHNSLIIADPNAAYVLEMVGRWWIAEEIKDFRSISNDLSIRGKGDLRKDGLIEHAINKGYCTDDNSFDFAITFASDQPMPSYVKCSMGQLSEKKGEITPKIMMDFLREHEGNICRHKRKDITAGSQVSHLRKGKKSIHWFTGSALPCLSIFKPYTFPIEDQHVLESGPYSEVFPNWYWNRHMKFIKPNITNPLKENPERKLIQDSIKRSERHLLEKIENLINLDNTIVGFTKEDFITEIKSIHNLAWKESEDLII